MGECEGVGCEERGGKKTREGCLFISLCTANRSEKEGLCSCATDAEVQATAAEAWWWQQSGLEAERRCCRQLIVRRTKATRMVEGAACEHRRQLRHRRGNEPVLLASW